MLNKEKHQMSNATRLLQDKLKSPFTEECKIYRLENITPDKNIKKFYELWIKPTDQNQASLIVVQGRIGSKGKAQVHLLAVEGACRVAALEILERQLGLGYKIVES
jgi:predicted DNA-binding WGR domain protein